MPGKRCVRGWGVAAKWPQGYARVSHCTLYHEGLLLVTYFGPKKKRPDYVGVFLLGVDFEGYKPCECVISDDESNEPGRASYVLRCPVCAQ